jgi:hypothetical protein
MFGLWLSITLFNLFSVLFNFCVFEYNRRTHAPFALRAVNLGCVMFSGYMFILMLAVGP